jgi:DNA replicative helicase MCM subunit Mcm2 (Cdc46/Mcm family)
MSNQINSAGMSQMGLPLNSDQEKFQMQEAANEFMNLPESRERIRGLIGRGTRFNLNIDEIRQFNPKLSQFISKKPIEAIKIFEDQLNVTLKGLQEDSGKQN